MPLKPGMSFLNVGSGTGYFNSIVSELIGELSTNHGIDIWPETLNHAKERCGQLEKHNIDYFLGNVYQIDVGRTMRYDRIYLGACANSRSKHLYHLLEVGGTLVGPFQAGATQQLRRVVRHAENRFSVEVLESIRFAPLVEPLPTEPTAFAAEASGCESTELELMEGVQSSSRASNRLTQMSSASGARTPGDEANQIVGLPGVPFTFSINDRTWTPELCYLFPLSFRRIVLMGLLSRPALPQWKGEERKSYCLPTDVWTRHIFPCCSRLWFETRETMAPLRLPALCKAFGAEEDGELSDDGGGSTRAPSSRQSSAHTTPDSTPALSPPHPPAMSFSVDYEDMAQLYLGKSGFS